MQPHQQRVVDELTELKAKTIKLGDFIGASPLFGELDSTQQGLLDAQWGVMEAYCSILALRIASF